MQKFLAKKGFILIIVIVLTVGIYIGNMNTSYSNKDEGINFFEKLKINNSIIDMKMLDDLDGLFYDNMSNSYFFKGNVVNNYVVLNNELWRIVSIDNDKNIKVIKNTAINNNQLYVFNNDYLKYDYHDSDVMKELLTWYDSSLSNLDSLIKINKYCVELRNDECLATKEYKIGLMDSNEVKRAGGLVNTNNESYYLYNENDWWIIDTDYDDVIASAYSGYVNLLGSIEKGFVDEAKTIRPVITLNNDVKVNGNGTLEDPYYIVN